MVWVAGSEEHRWKRFCHVQVPKPVFICRFWVIFMVFLVLKIYHQTQETCIGVCRIKIFEIRVQIHGCMLSFLHSVLVAGK